MGKRRHRLLFLQPAERQPPAPAMRHVSEEISVAAMSHELQENGRAFPPNYLHESWRDYLYWDTELESG